MKWSEENTKDLKQLCMDETPNKDIAAYFGVGVTEIHAKRSQLGITIPKVREAKYGFNTAVPKPSGMPKSIKQAFTDLHNRVLLKMANDGTGLEDAQIYCELCEELIELQSKYETKLAKEKAASGAGTLETAV